MTVIVWDGETLAADRLMSDGYSRDSTTKIFEFDGKLYASTGEAHVGLAMIDWHRKGADPEKFPRTQHDSHAATMIVIIDGVLYHYGSDKPPVPVRAEGNTAWGCGSEAAYAAMAIGLDAIEAVRLACKVNIKCGNGIDALRVGGWKKRYSE